MKKTLLAAVAALAAACGGNDSKLDPTTVKFTYGSSSTPVDAATTSSAATTATTALSATPSMDQATTLDSTAADPNVGSIITLPDSMSSQVMASSTTVMSAQTGVAGKAIQVGIGKLTPTAAGFDPACVTASLTRVTYSGCVVDVTNTDGTWRVTVNGTVTRALLGTGPATANVAWDLSTHFDGTSTTTGYSLALDVHQTGAVTITEPAVSTDDWTLTGSARADTNLRFSMTGMSVSASETLLTDYNLAFQYDAALSQATPTNGTIELRRVWTEQPAGSNEPDVGVLFTWNGGAVTAVFGARQ